MKFLPNRRCLAGLALVATAATASTPNPPVTVSYVDAEHFTETRESMLVGPAERDRYLDALKAYIEKRAARILGPEERLAIHVTDIDRAGAFEPWRGPNLRDVRIVRDVYPPSIDLQFTLYGADGSVRREGQRHLRDLAFLERFGGLDTDPLRYEKALVDRWLRRGPEDL